MQIKEFGSRASSMSVELDYGIQQLFMEIGLFLDMVQCQIRLLIKKE